MVKVQSLCGHLVTEAEIMITVTVMAIPIASTLLLSVVLPRWETYPG